MYALRIEHPVPDYDGWKQAFEADPVGRKQAGVRSYQVARDVTDPDYVLIDLRFATLDEATAMLSALRGLWTQVEGRVMRNPQARIVEVVETGDL